MCCATKAPPKAPNIQTEWCNCARATVLVQLCSTKAASWVSLAPSGGEANDTEQAKLLSDRWVVLQQFAAGGFLGGLCLAPSEDWIL